MNHKVSTGSAATLDMQVNDHRWNVGRTFWLNQMELQGISKLYPQTFVKFTFFSTTTTLHATTTTLHVCITDREGTKCPKKDHIGAKI